MPCMEETLVKVRESLRNALDREAEAQREIVRLRLRTHELEEAVQARDDFIAILGHELRNPLSPVLLHAQLLLKQLRDRELSKDWLLPNFESLVQRLHGFLRTLDQMVDASRLRTGSVALSPSNIDLTEVVREVCHGMDRDLAFGDNQLHLVASDSIPGCWDRLRIEQIVRNLLSNAIRYGAGKPIDIQVDADRDVARFMVRDRGPGIAPEHQDRIFHKYERAVMAPHTGGFGLGLWVVRTLCESMGGRIEVQSQPGQGALFVVTLPRQRSSDDVEHCTA
jgi:signal transduction histidine kinase